MHVLIQADAEISEILMNAFIHRRIALVAQGIGDALLIGSPTPRQPCASGRSSRETVTRSSIWISIAMLMCGTSSIAFMWIQQNTWRTIERCPVIGADHNKELLS